mmetsp:Transcript_13465/g.47475  ORF Transcript_13465/g.47475 Transcript_13465/m.47475 type:complete len:228 (-) Transcript_13465:1565-2248(-)
MWTPAPTLGGGGGRAGVGGGEDAVSRKQALEFRARLRVLREQELPSCRSISPPWWLLLVLQFRCRNRIGCVPVGTTMLGSAVWTPRCFFDLSSIGRSRSNCPSDFVCTAAQASKTSRGLSRSTSTPLSRPWAASACPHPRPRSVSRPWSSQASAPPAACLGPRTRCCRPCGRPSEARTTSCAGQWAGCSRCGGLWPLVSCWCRSWLERCPRCWRRTAPRSRRCGRWW